MLVWHPIRWRPSLLTFALGGCTSASRKAHQIISPVFICFPFGRQIHCAMSPFCPFWHLSPYWLSTIVLCGNAWCHIYVGDIFDFFIFIFQCGVFRCLLIFLANDGFHFVRKCITFLVYIFVCDSCTREVCHFSCGVYAICYQFCLKMENGYEHSFEVHHVVF